ncbi:LOW QUALITY PROTEIN: cytoplasmic dynein 1 light intermediate chain 2-like [Haliotis rubra]|uniref:LOW QUALITY PROTEIN: cytoplasmic dynein 1 light intermediate chain 2-like n=1 Tax=Haliotis rubra TaxID=36100 RepID=UPI001EE5A33D|nr:LOW QUALITY PROTEIN: cytoplasmic dynein 1 light intermediate chain 2-like [Haliotis rubra]
MAPIGEKDDRMGTSVGDDGSTDDSQNLWAHILSEVQSSSASKLSSSRSVLVLGDNDSGKTTLIAKLQGVEEPKKGSGLEYYYIDVKDEYRDEQARLNVWCLDGDPSHTGLLKYALTEQNFSDTLVLLVASMTHPWSLMEALEKWVSILREHIDRLKIPSEKMRDYEQSLVRFFQEYSAPEEGHSTSAPHRGDSNPLHPSASATDEEKVLLPLGESTLSQNLGIPIVVVITKSDAISTLEKEHDFREEHFDFIQQHIRKFCLSYGASLLYSSVKEDRNCELLYKYLVHRVYGFPFTSQAYVVEKDSVFVPSGWDNEKKISILYENMSSMKPEDAFDDVIAKPITRKPVQRDAEVTAEDEQVFLMKQQTQLSKQPQPGTQGPAEGTPQRMQRPQVQRTPERQGSSPSTPGRGKSPKGEGKAPAGATSEGMLANFFNSLLNKKTGQPGGAGTGTGTPPISDKVSRDAAAELERMTRGKKPAETNSNDTSASGS